MRVNSELHDSDVIADKKHPLCGEKEDTSIKLSHYLKETKIDKSGETFVNQKSGRKEELVSEKMPIKRSRHWIEYSQIDLTAIRRSEAMHSKWYRKPRRPCPVDPDTSKTVKQTSKTVKGLIFIPTRGKYGYYHTDKSTGVTKDSAPPLVSSLPVQSDGSSNGELDRFLNMTTEWKLPEGSSITVPVALECFSRKDLKHKERVGRGAQANISLYTTEFREDVMLKEYRPTYASDMMKEIVLLQKVNSHQYIVRVLGLLFETDEDLKKGRYPRGFLMEPLACSLTHVIEDRNSEITVQQIMKWVLQISSAVVFLHKLHIYHADLKPDNLLLTDDNVIKLADFGISSMKDHPCSVGTMPLRSYYSRGRRCLLTIKQTSTHSESASGRWYTEEPHPCVMLEMNYMNIASILTLTSTVNRF